MLYQIDHAKESEDGLNAFSRIPGRLVQLVVVVGELLPPLRRGRGRQRREEEQEEALEREAGNLGSLVFWQGRRTEGEVRIFF